MKKITSPLPRTLVKGPALKQQAALEQLGFIIDPDSATRQFILATPPKNWLHKRVGRNPNGKGERVEFLDEQSRLRIVQIEHLETYAHLDTIEILPVD